MAQRQAIAHSRGLFHKGVGHAHPIVQPIRHHGAWCKLRAGFVKMHKERLAMAERRPKVANCLLPFVVGRKIAQLDLSVSPDSRGLGSTK